MKPDSFATRDTVSARVRNVSQSDLVSHAQSTAAWNTCTYGCISVEDKSSFSYHVAAGNTISEYKPVEAIRKSISIKRSSLPASSASRHLISSGFTGASSSSRTPCLVPSKCFKKYSWPLEEEPIRFARHTNKLRGWFSLAAGSSTQNCNSLFFNACATYWLISASVLAPAARASLIKAWLPLLKVG